MIDGQWIGLKLTPYELETEWRKRIKGMTDLPARVELSAWSRMELARHSGGEVPSAPKGRRSDVASLRLVYLTIDRLFDRSWYSRSRATKVVQAHLIHLAATPHLFKPDPLPAEHPEDWVGPWIENDVIEALRPWVRTANWKLEMATSAGSRPRSRVAKTVEQDCPSYGTATFVDFLLAGLHRGENAAL